MGVERHGPKGGGSYVGGFFQLFDWNAKSRKKLFSNKSDLPERSKQGKRGDTNFPMTRLHMVDEDESGAGSSIKESSDYSCASSVTDDDGYGTKAPGVVARLMGLDTLPTSNSVEPYSTPFFDSQSLREAHPHRKNLDFHHGRPVMHSRNSLGKVDGPARANMESKLQKLNKPIEKFQTEVLPPKSAKSIPSTQHRLLSPIKSAGFVPTKNAAHIMEAAAKIIEQGPQTTTKAKVSMLGSSGPLKVRDLKERVEAPQRPSRLAETPRRPIESNAAKHLKGQSLNKSWNGSVDTSFKLSGDTEESSSSLKSKGKSISLAIQAKVNVQRREGLNPSSRSSVGMKEQSEVKSSQSFKCQSSMQKSTNRKSSTQTSGVLRQNNQKQNCMIDKDKLSSKASVSNLQGRKAASGESSVGRQKKLNKSTGNPKVGSRKLSLELTDNEQEVSYSRMKNLPRKKRIIDGDFCPEKNRGVNTVLTNKNEKPIQFNAVTDRHFNWAEGSSKKGMDVVSFTFTAPMVRSTSGSEPSRQMSEKNNGLFPGPQVKKVLVNSDGRKLSSLGFNVIGGDALSALLEQKLKELTYGIEPSLHNSIKTVASSNTTSVLDDLIPTLNVVGDMPNWHDNRDLHGLRAGKYGRHYDSNMSSNEPPELQTKYKFQGVEEEEKCNNGVVEARQMFDSRHPSPISILEPFPAESFNSSDSAGSDSTEGSRQCSSVQAHEVIGLGSSKKFCSVETDADLSDSASSMSAGTAARKHATTVITRDYVRSTKWELEYVKEILCSVELMFKDFALGRAREIINPHLFDQLESRKGELDIDDGESRTRRKVLFDCVSECLDLRCRRFVGGGCGTWMKGVTMVRRNVWLAEEVYKEISGWRSMGDCMVDELIEKDMSSQHGKWVDFEVEAFGIGVEIEDQILSSLVDEVVADFLIL